MIQRLLALLLCMVSSASAFALHKPDHYQIDLIIFSRLTPKNLGSEYWRSSPPWKPKQHLVELAPTPEKPQDSNEYPDLTLLPTNALALTHEASKLEQLKNVTVLAELAWKMSRHQLRKPITIALHGGHFISPSILQEDAADPNLELSGSITLSLKRYFNATLRLILSEPQEAVTHELLEDRNCSFDGICRFYFQRTRRTRSKQLNYIDTPLLGVLLSIKPLKSEKAAK